jgi:enoyl-CoA hydratase
MQFETLLYEVKDRKAYITLNRPQVLNAINIDMPREIESAVYLANSDRNVHVIVISGAGDAFCSGYDLKAFAEAGVGTQPKVWDPMLDFHFMKENTDHFSSLFRSLKPTICKVHGYAVAGGSDIALCCDLIIMAKNAKIGYMPARVWGTPTTAMWALRLGLEKAKAMLFTGDVIDGEQAKEWGLVLDAVDEDVLDNKVEELADRIAGVPINQLMMQKLVLNQMAVNAGMNAMQTMATVFDGISRHSPEGRWFQKYAAENGFHEAVNWRDSGKWIPDGEVPEDK